MQILQIGFSKQDNLGDKLAVEALGRVIKEVYPAATISIEDPLHRHAQKRGFLDPLAINDSYDLVTIGAGGLIDSGFIRLIFENADEWGLLKKPLIVLGCGIRKNYGLDHTKTQEEADCFEQFLQKTKCFGIRDFRTKDFLLDGSISTDRIFYTGCPTLLFAQGKTDQKHIPLAANLPLRHGITHQKQSELVALFQRLLDEEPDLHYLAHSTSELEEAKALQERLGSRFTILAPQSFSEVQTIYGQIDKAVVLKNHAAIFSALNGVNFQLISYDIKCDGFLELIKEESRSHSILDFDSQKIITSLQTAPPLDSSRLDRLIEEGHRGFQKALALF